MKKFSLFILSLLLFGCASQHASNKKFMQSKSYQNRPTLKHSLFGSEGKDLTEKELQVILDSKIKLPKRVRLGVVKLEQRSSYTTGNQWAGPSSLMNSKTFILNDKLADQFFGKIKSSGRVLEITALPTMMIPPSLSVQALREAAARIQVDVLLVIKSENLADYEYLPFWGKDKAKTLSTVEAVLLDVRTGIIPSTAIATDSSLIRESEEDVNHFDLIRKSIEEAETKALSRIAGLVADFFKALP